MTKQTGRTVANNSLIKAARHRAPGALHATAVAAVLLLASLLAGCTRGGGASAEPAAATHAGGTSNTIRVAIIGGMTDTGFWDAVVKRFQEGPGRGFQVEVVATGPKHVIGPVFARGEADLITMHASDTIINLVADGHATDPQPWLKNDLVIVGPRDDPAGIRGLHSAKVAFARIAEKKSPFVVHASLGAQEVMREILSAGDVLMPSERLHILFSDRAPEVLRIAAEKQAYTLVGRIPFRSGKLPNAGLEIMLQGDPLLRRPYVVAVADPARYPTACVAGARRLAAFLTSAETQEWIRGYGVGQLDDQPLFYPVTPRPSAAEPR
ncbi:MAG: substrate-binding domain-containing protein [Planctomycetota bacterium]